MKNLLLLVLAFVVVETAAAQKNQVVTLTKTDGGTLEFPTKCRYYKGGYYYPEDGKPYIKGTVNGVKTQVPKSELTKITQADGQEYTIIKSNGKYVIGQFVTKGTIEVFKMYWYGHGGAPGIAFGTGGVAVGMGGSANKTISVVYSEYVNGNLESISMKNYIQKLSQVSPEFAKVAEGKRAKDEKVFEELVVEYNKLSKP